MSFPLPLAVLLSVLLFVIGAAGFLLRRNVLIAFLSVELMMNAANLALVAFAHRWGGLDGKVLVFFVLAVAAAEAAVGLGLILALVRRRKTLDVDALDLLRW